jgi:hypothetical protein
VEVRGGAVELSWTIQDLDGDGRRCDAGPFESIQLTATRVDAEDDYASDAWACDRYHGVTKFEIPEGRWAMELLVRCVGGDVANVGVPDPIVRDVRDGEVAQLNALLIVLQDGTCPSN